MHESLFKEILTIYFSDTANVVTSVNAELNLIPSHQQYITRFCAAQSVQGRKFEPGTYQIRSGKANYLATIFCGLSYFWEGNHSIKLFIELCNHDALAENEGGTR
jgi:hypothetical protein